MEVVKVDKFGRVLIPKKLRDSLGLEPGETLSSKVEDGKLVFEPHGKLELVQKGKVLVIRGGKLLRDGDFVNEMREERITELIRRLYEDTD
jgi:AbrB family looped-hinge helix DNA binding protein